VDHARLERLAQFFEHAAIPFGQFVEEQHAMVGQRDFARPQIAAAADQRDTAGRVVRSTIRTHAPGRGREAARQRCDRGGREGVVFGQRRPDTRQTLREHRLAASRGRDRLPPGRTSGLV